MLSRSFINRTRLARLLAASLAVIILASVPGCSRPTKPQKVTMAVASWPGSAPAYVAHAKGFFLYEGLDLTIVPEASGKSALAAVLAGEADFVGVTDTPIVRAILDGEKPAIIATTAVVNTSVVAVARKDRGIAGVTDLPGKRVGLPMGTTAEFFLHMYLTTSHVDPGTVMVVDVAPDAVTGELASGNVDAICVWAPYSTMAQEEIDGNAVVLSDPNVYVSTWNMVVRQDYARGNPQAVQAFLRAIVKANAFISDHPDEAHDIYSDYTGTAREFHQGDWDQYEFSVGLDQSLVLNMEDQARWMAQRQTGDLSGIPTILDFIYTDGLKAVQPDAVRIPGR